MLQGLQESAADCRVNGVPRRLAGVLRRQLERLLPADAHERCSGNTHITITRLFPRPTAKVISSFASREDLISALLASCHIPGLSDGAITTRFRGRRVIDGGVLDLCPRPPGKLRVIKISCIPAAHIPKLPVFNTKAVLEGLAIAPDMFTHAAHTHPAWPGPWAHSFKQTIQWSLSPGPDSFVRELVARGQADAAAWVHTTSIARRLNLGHLPALGLADLLPGAQQPSPASSAAGSRRGAKDGGAPAGGGAKGEAAASPIAAAVPGVRAE